MGLWGVRDGNLGGAVGQLGQAQRPCVKNAGPEIRFGWPAKSLECAQGCRKGWGSVKKN